MSTTFTHKLTEDEQAMLCNFLELSWTHKQELSFEDEEEELAYETVFDKVFLAKPAGKENK